MGPRWVAAVTVLALVLACDHSTASPRPPTPTAPRPATGDEKTPHAVEARAVALTRSQGKLTFAIGLPKELDPGVIGPTWTGRFTADGKDIAGSNFMLTMAKGREIRAELAADALPSPTVRLYPPGY